MGIRIKRAYGAPAESDGRRIFVDRFWPRGVSKEEARIDSWPKEIAPSNGLRRWYDHDPVKWPEFKERYLAELDGNRELLQEILRLVRRGRVTFVYSSKERNLNNAVALKEYVESLM